MNRRLYEPTGPPPMRPVERGAIPNLDPIDELESLDPIGQINYIDDLYPHEHDDRPPPRYREQLPSKSRRYELLLLTAIIATMGLNGVVYGGPVGWSIGVTFLTLAFLVFLGWLGHVRRQL